jgi:hypothetical protein
MQQVRTAVVAMCVAIGLRSSYHLSLTYSAYSIISGIVIDPGSAELQSKL